MKRAEQTSRRSDWVGGIFPVPGYVTGEDKPYRPEIIVWANAEGAILGFELAKPGAALGKASDSLRETIERPQFGRPHTPKRIRVASAELAAALCDSFPRIEITVGPTPEVDNLLASMREQIASDDDERSYASWQVEPDAIAAFFGAAAELYRAAPWDVFPDDQSVLSVDIGAIGLRGGVLSVIGQMGDSLGVLLFSGFGDFEQFLAAAVAANDDEHAPIPPHFAINYDRLADMTPTQRSEIAEHRWELATEDACPWLLAIEVELMERPLTRDDVVLAEALARALTRFVRKKKALRSAWNGGKAVSETIIVKTHAGEVEITLRAPHPEDVPFPDGDE